MSFTKGTAATSSKQVPKQLGHLRAVGACQLAKGS